MRVFFDDESKLGVPRAREIGDTVCAEKLAQVIVVLNDGITPIASKFFQDMRNEHPNVIINTFLKLELGRFYPDHFLVPPQRKLTKMEKEAFLKKRTVRNDQMTNLPPNDPICKIYGWKAGDFILSIRKFGGSLEPVKKILCVDAPSFKPMV